MEGHQDVPLPVMAMVAMVAMVMAAATAEMATLPVDTLMGQEVRQ